MASDLVAVRFLAQQPERLADFWAGLLGAERADDVTLLPVDPHGLRIRFVGTDRPKTTKNQAHVDLTSTSPEDQQTRVARALALGGHPLDIGQRPEEGHVVLADPEGNELCVIAAGNRFLEGCGLVGALACDGSEAVGRFWSAALDWPLVWDQDQETAVQSPRGGTKVTWGGPPFPPPDAQHRVRLELAPHGDLETELQRLVGLGATRVAAAPDGSEVTLADPDGNHVAVLVPG